MEKSIGLLSDPLPRPSIMQMKLLEEEAMRHFPQMDRKARAAYVSHSIEQANKKPPTITGEEIDIKGI